MFLKSDLTSVTNKHMATYLPLIRHYNAISIAATLCMIFQHQSHKFIPIFQSTLAMAVPQKQMWEHRLQHGHNQLNNKYAGIHTY